MINKQILDYINQQLQRGVDKEQIKNSLITNGWQIADIEEAFKAVESGVSVSGNSSEQSTQAVNSTQTNSYAGFWIRVGAVIIDGIIINIVLAIIGGVFVFSSYKNNSALSNFLLVQSVPFLIWIFYYPFMESQSGATFGKKILRIKVINVNGEPVSFLRSLLRNLAKIISAFIFMIGFIMVGFTKKKQGLHDMIAGCVVVKVDK